MSRAKCGLLLAGDTDAPENTGWMAQFGRMDRVLRGLGYDVETIYLGTADTWIYDEDGTNYDFFVAPRASAEISIPTNQPYGKMAIKGASRIPMIVCHYNQGAAGTPQNGVNDRYSPANKHTRYSYKDTGLNVYLSSYRYQIDPAKVSITTSILQEEMDADGVSDQYHGAWRYLSENSPTNAPYYFEGGNTTTLLPLLIHEAVKDGNIPAPPTKKQFSIDLDDFPDATNTKVRVDEMHAYLADNGLKATCGIHGVSGVSYQEDWPAFIAQQVANGGCFYTIDHQTSSDPYFFDWNLVDGGDMDALGTVAEKQALALSRHTSVNDAFTAAGLPFRGYNQEGWRYFNNNRVTLEGLKVLADLGFKYARLNRSTTADMVLRSTGFVASAAEQYGIKFYEYGGSLSGTANSYAWDTSDYIIYQGFAYQSIFVQAFDARYTSFYAHNFDFYDSGVSGKTGEGPAAVYNTLDVLQELDTVFEPVASPLMFRT